MIRRITIDDVAKKAGVSKSTVSQYLNERFDYMGLETKRKIEQVITELQYRPNVIARSLKMKSTSTIGVIVANILHAYSTQVIKAIESVFNENEISTIICNADDDSEKEKRYIETLLAKQVDGLIVAPISKNLETYEKLIKGNIPIVFIDRLVDGLNNDAVLLNNEEASSIAVNYLAENNYEKIAILTTSLLDNITPRVERINGYKKALKENNMEIRPDYIKGVELEEIKYSMEELFSLPDPPDSIISGNDLTLMKILAYTIEKGISIGKDIGLVTIDEVSFAALYTPSITTIAQPTLEMGTKAALILLDKINGEKNYKENTIHRYSPSLIIRDSAMEID